MTFHEFITKVDNQFYANDMEQPLRYGQIVMNTLHDVWPEKYKELVESECDCFYDKKMVVFVLDRLRKEWLNDE